VAPARYSSAERGSHCGTTKGVLAEPGPRFLRRDVESGRATTKLKPGRRAARHTSTVYAVAGTGRTNLVKVVLLNDFRWKVAC